MATYLDGNVRKATANTVTAMKRSADRRRCPKCGRGSALIDVGDGAKACRWGEQGLCDYYAPSVFERMQDQGVPFDPPIVTRKPPASGRAHDA